MNDFKAWAEEQGETVDHDSTGFWSTRLTEKGFESSRGGAIRGLPLPGIGLRTKIMTGSELMNHFHLFCHLFLKLFSRIREKHKLIQMYSERSDL